MIEMRNGTKRARSSFSAELRLRAGAEAPRRFAHLARQTSIDKRDATPCSCGSPFRDHDWVLTVEGENIVLTCSAQED